MNKTISTNLFRTITILAIVLTLLGANVQSAAALPNPGAVLPIPVGTTAKYSQGAHKSGFKMGYITNKGVQNSSIDLGYSGAVTAPISGKIMIAKSCADGQQIVFINANRGSYGNGWSIGLVHIHIDVAKGIKEGLPVTQGQIIGYTVLPPKTDNGQGCGYGSGMHIHYTLMKWKIAAQIKQKSRQ